MNQEALTLQDAAKQVVDQWKERMKNPEFIEPNMDALREYAQKLREPVTRIATAAMTEDEVATAMVRRSQILMFIKSKEVIPFEVDNHNYKILRGLKLYVMRDKRFEEEGYGSLSKGICLRGLPGCGKSMLLKVLSDAAQPWSKHSGKLTSVKELQREGWGDGLRFGLYNMTDIYSCVGIEHKYRQKNGEQYLEELRTVKRRLAFDDLGFERSETMNYGNRINIMEQIIQHRYDLFLDTGVPTDFSTNLVNGDDIERIYGPRVRGRLREMCNFFDFDTENHQDRRK